MDNINKSKKSITVGIPAYNEEKNIGELIDSLLSQVQSDYVLKEIIVCVDGSSDKTVEVIESRKSKYIILVQNKNRIGQQEAQNRILELRRGEIVVFVEADVLPRNYYVVNELVKPLINDNSDTLGMVVGDSHGISPRTFIEKISTHGDLLKKKIADEWKNGDNIYNSSGQAMKALSNSFASKLRWKSDVPEDSYAYLMLKKMKMNIFKQKKAETFKRNVANLGDSIKQSAKFTTGKKALKEYFRDDVVDNEFSFPHGLIIKHVLTSILQKPLFTLLYILQVGVNRVFSARKNKFNKLYVPYRSTKRLIGVDNEY